MVERLLYTQDVGGSSPSPPTNLQNCGQARSQSDVIANVAHVSTAETDGPLSTRFCASG
jgi:hypothetical protein